MSDVLNISREEYLRLPEHKQQALKLKVCTTSGLDSEIATQQRILEYIYVNSLSNTPVTLSDVNRRYSRPAKQHGTSVTALVHELVDADVLCVLERHGVSALFSTTIYKDMERGLIERGSTSNLTDNIMSIFE